MRTRRSGSRTAWTNGAGPAPVRSAPCRAELTQDFRRPDARAHEPAGQGVLHGIADFGDAEAGRFPGDRVRGASSPLESPRRSTASSSIVAR